MPASFEEGGELAIEQGDAETEKFGEVTSVQPPGVRDLIQEQVFNFGIAYHTINHCACSVDEFIIRSVIQDHRFLYCDCQRHIEIESLSDLKTYAGNHIVSKPAGSYPQFIDTGREIGDYEDTDVVRDGLSPYASRLLRHRHLSSGDQRAV